MYSWMDRWTADGQGQMDGQMGRFLGGQTNGWTELMIGWIDEWMDG